MSSDDCLLILHQPCWCEENIWHLAQHPAPGVGDRQIVVITGADHEVACWEQRAAKPGQPMLWDYHVVLAVLGNNGWQIWDLDTRLGCPVSADAWLFGTFPCPAMVHEVFQPRFLLISARRWIAEFSSDRSHMRTPNGEWQRPPPSWPLINAGSLRLADVLVQATRGLTLRELQNRLHLSEGRGTHLP